MNLVQTEPPGLQWLVAFLVLGGVAWRGLWSSQDGPLDQRQSWGYQGLLGISVLGTLTWLIQVLA